VAVILREQTRGTDTVCRFGGEEFLIVFPAQSLQEARICAERCRTAIQDHAFIVGDLTIKATVSIGLAGRAAEMEHTPDLLKVADRVMYDAKNCGRNVVRTSEDPPPSELWCELPQSGKTASSAAPAVPPVDLQVVLKRCGGDAKFAAAVTEKFRSQAGGQVDKIQEALSQTNGDALARAAHSLKSMAAYMSADTAADLARRIENMSRVNQLCEIEPLLSRLKEEIQATIEWLAANASAAAPALANFPTGRP
jgi:HPt (histidine-containing phosphotransfer) domain-containing protein